MRKKLIYLIGTMLLLSLCSYVIIKINKAASFLTDNEKNDLLIVTSFYPMYIATLNIVDGVDGVQLKNLTSNQTGCVHDYQLTTDDMRHLSGADIAIINGGEMEAFMEEAIENQKGLAVITASNGIEFLKESEHRHEGEIINQEKADEGHEEASHEHGTVNGHVWMNTDYYIQQVSNIATQLASLDEKHARQYEENAAHYIQKIKQLNKDYVQKLKDLADGEKIIIFHDAFAYLADQLGMDVVYTVEVESETSLNAGEIAAVIEEIHEHGIQYLFTEEQYSDYIAQSIANETSAKVYAIDSLVAGEADKNAYLDGMKNNLLLLQTILK